MNPNLRPGSFLRGAAPFHVLLLLVLLLSSYVRVSNLSIPFERDEGEYAYAARLILQGIPTFQEAYNMKMPGIYYTYAAIMSLFGESVEGVHLGLVFAILLTALALYCLLSRLYSPFVGCAAAGVFSIVSMTPKIQGIAANAEYFVLLPALIGMLLLDLSMRPGRAWLRFPAGLMLGTAFAVKQHGVVFVLLGLLYLAHAQITEDGFRGRALLRNLLFFGVASLLPLLAVVVLMFSHGVFERFWFWTFVYASRYVTMTSPLDGFSWLRLLMGHLVSSAPLPWILSLLGLAALVPFRISPLQKGFALGLFFFSFAAVSAGFYYRPHYFILLLPSVGLLAGIALDFLRQALQKFFVRKGKNIAGVLAPLFLFVSLGHSVYVNREAFFSMSPVQLSRASYGLNPFPEAIEVAHFIRERSSPADTIAVVGSEPEIYFYTKRRAATGYMYSYPLTENHPFAVSMQREMTSQIEKAMPRFLVFVGNPFSWSVTSGAPEHLFEWFHRFRTEHYTLVGTTETLSFHQTRYAWDEEARDYQRKSRFWIDVFERKG